MQAELNRQDPQRTTTRPIAADTPPDLRIGSWAEPNDEPILDAARVPLGAFRANKPPYRATGMYIWLHVLRPGLLILFWIGLGAYVWRHLFQPSEHPQSTGPLAIYGAMIALIFLAMLLLAPFRRHAHRSGRRAVPTAVSSMKEIAAYADLSSGSLSDWRQARTLVVQHDQNGRLCNASDLGSAPAR